MVDIVVLFLAVFFSHYSFYLSFVLSFFLLKHHSGAEQQVWLPAPVPDDLLCLAPGLQSSALWAVETLQRSASAVRHPPGVCQGEGHSNHSGSLQGMCRISHSFCVSLKCHFAQICFYHTGWTAVPSCLMDWPRGPQDLFPFLFFTVGFELTFHHMENKATFTLAGWFLSY